MLRTVCVFVLLLFPLAAIAAPTPGPNQAHDGGVISGRILSVDLVRDTLEIDAGSRGRVNVEMPPSVSVQGQEAGYHTITDLRPGQHVAIRASIVGERIVAQIITILP